MKIKNLKLLGLVIVLIAAGLLIFLVTLSGPWLSGRYAIVQKFRTSVFSKINMFSSFIAELDKTKDLMEENLALKDENMGLVARLAAQAELKVQNDFLREAVNLEIIPEAELIDAGVFNSQFSPRGHFFLINKGEREGIEVGNVVITFSGVLLGKISDVFKDYSRLSLIINPDVKVTVRIMNRSTVGISKGILSEGIMLDYISQNDEIVEGDRVITNGNDLFPGGLIIGTVSKINSDNGNVFKDVFIKPAFKNVKIDRVLVIKN